MNDKSKLDPRYDPAFQRGYSGEVQTAQHPHGVLRASRPVRDIDRGTTEAGPVPPAAVVAPAVVPDAAPLVTWAEQPPVEASFDSDEDLDEPAVDPAPLRKLLRNPFLGVLTLLGAALAIAGASWMISARGMMLDSGSFASERDYWFVQSALLGGPTLIATGVAILAGVLFVFASAWNRSR